MTSHLSWGRNLRFEQKKKFLRWRHEDVTLLLEPGKTHLPVGYGRSYGDSALNQGGILIDTTHLDRFVKYDRQTGLIRCDAGVSLDQVLQLTVRDGWFLPVTPGTKFVSVAGAVANDVHGKNHVKHGTFGRYVRRFELARSDGARLECSEMINPELFRATIGGMGLTGVMTWVEIQLVRIPSAFVDCETIKFDRLEDFYALADQSDQSFDYTVAWVDTLATGAALGRGHYIRANFAPDVQTSPFKLHKDPQLFFPIDAPSLLLNQATVRAFNTVYYQRQRAKKKLARMHYEPFFYPLDAISGWNKMYGRRGFYQYQFVVPTTARAAVKEIFQVIASSGAGSFLVVFKSFGDLPSPGMMSFPMPGYTLALDFANRGQTTLDLFARLDRLVFGCGGRLYPAKDAHMSAASFQASYPQWQEFARYVDPMLSSSFWRRVTCQ